MAQPFRERHTVPDSGESSTGSSGHQRVPNDAASGILGQYRESPHPAKTHEEDIDGLATLPSYGDADETYGPSSTVMFTRSIGKPGGKSQPIGTPKRLQQSLPPLRDQDCVLPLRRNADDHLACYWNFIHPVFPVLHKPSFILQYSQVWNGQTEEASEYDERTFLALLNMVFALGSRFSSTIPAEACDEASNEFWLRSRRAYTYDVLDRPSLGVVQLLLLSGVYLQSSQSASACWNVVGLAVRVAQSIGLHVEPDGEQPATQRRPIQLQTRRKVWHTCVSLDRLLAMTFGRPAMIADAGKVPLPVMVDDEYIHEEGCSLQPAGETTYMLLFSYSCKLFDILSDILQLYSAETTATLPVEELVIQTLKTTGRLEVFKYGVPPVLNEHAANITQRPGAVQLQQQILLCRYLYVKLLSLRPLLYRSLRTNDTATASTSTPGKSSLDALVVGQCCHECIETACELVDTIHQSLATPYRSAGWHAVYFTVSAATVILARYKCPNLSRSIGSDRLEVCWQQCLVTLDYHAESIPTASRAVTVLQSVRKQIADGGSVNGHSELSSAQAKQPETSNGNGSVHDDLDNSGDDALDELAGFDMDRISEAWLNECLADLDWPSLPAG